MELTLYSQLCFAVSILKKSLSKAGSELGQGPGPPLNIYQLVHRKSGVLHLFTEQMNPPPLIWIFFSISDPSHTPSLLTAAVESSWQPRPLRQRRSAGCLTLGEQFYKIFCNISSSVPWHAAEPLVMSVSEHLRGWSLYWTQICLTGTLTRVQAFKIIVTNLSVCILG